MTTNEIDAQRPDNVGRQRIAKLMARVGLCSRRDAEAWVLEGRVKVNGTVLTSPATDVGPEDTILVDDAPLPAAEKTRLFLFHKPRGLVTSDHDPEGRPTVADFLRERWPQGPRVVTIGRLDINTEGLLLLTNDGGLARVLELPRTGWVRRYRVRANGETDQGVLDGLRGGIAIDGVDYAGIEAALDRVQGANVWLTMALREGKNREVKRVLEHIGLGVNRLIRLSFGPFQLGELAEGAVEEVRTRVLRDQLGEALARAAGVDFGEAAPQQVRSDRPKGGEPRTERPAGPRRDARNSERPGGARRDERLKRPADARRTDAPRSGRDADAPGGRGGSRRRPEVEVPPPVRERPAKGTRKHVSVLRADEAAAKGPRMRTERADVKDRRDRTVAVERRVAARGRLEPTRSRRPGGRAATGEAEARPTRRQASPSAEAKRARAARSGAARPERETRRGFQNDGDRPEREKSFRTKAKQGRSPGRGRTEVAGVAPLPLPGRGKGWGSGRASRPAMKDTRTPTPNPSPQGGGEAHSARSEHAERRLKGNGSKPASRSAGRHAPPSPARVRRPDEVGSDERSRRSADVRRRGGKTPHPPSAPPRGATFSRKRDKEESALVKREKSARRSDAGGDRKPDGKRTQRPGPHPGKPRGKPPRPKR